MTYNDAGGVCLALTLLILAAFGGGMLRPSILRLRGRREVAVGTLLPSCALLGAAGALFELQKGATTAVALSTAVTLFSVLLIVVLATAFLLGVASPSILGLSGRRRVAEFTLYPAMLLFLIALMTTGLTADESRVLSKPTNPAEAPSDFNETARADPPPKSDSVGNSRASRSMLSAGVEYNGGTGDRTPTPATETAPTEASTPVAPQFRAAYEVNYPSCKHFRDETLQEFDTDSESVAAERVSREFPSGASRQGAFAGCLDGLMGRTARFSMAGAKGS